jgi:hypothetical protein
LNGSGAANGGLLVKDATAPNTVSGSLLWDSTNDYWKGGALGSESKLLVAGGDGVVSGSSQVVGILSSLNTYTGSNDTTNNTQNSRLTSIESATGSYETKGRGIVSGSSQITLSSTTGYGSVLNQAVLTSSSPTFVNGTFAKTTINSDNSGLIVDVAGRHGIMKYANYATGFVGKNTGTDSNISVWLGRWSGTDINSPSSINQDLTINNSGAATFASTLGVGTSVLPFNPRLAVNSTGQNTISVQTTDTAQGSAGTIMYMGTGATTGNSTYGVIRVLGDGGTAASNLVLQPDAGNTGFGLTNPQSQVHLNGTITLTESGFDTVRKHTITHSHSDGSSTNNYVAINVSDGSGTTAERIRVNGSGHVLPGANGTQDLGSTSLRWGTVYTSDLSLNNGIGDWTIVEGEDDLFLYNNKKGKVYKFALIEVDPNVATPKKS